MPLGLYLAGAGAAVAFSFVDRDLLRDIAWTRAYPRLNLLRYPLGRLMAHPLLLFVLKLAAVLLFALVVAAGFLGNQQPLRNIAPTAVWVVWWVGLAVVSAFVGDLWALINPWRTLFAWAEASTAASAAARCPSACATLEALGVWPAVVLLLLAWLELAFPGSALPANLARMAVGYSVITWTGMPCSRERWLRHGEVFALFFGLLARFAPLEIRVSEPRLCDACGLGCRDLDRDCINCATCFESAGAAERQWALRPYAMGLLRNEPGSTSMVAFVLLVMAAVLFDGLLATPPGGRSRTGSSPCSLRPKTFFRWSRGPSGWSGCGWCSLAPMRRSAGSWPRRPRAGSPPALSPGGSSSPSSRSPSPITWRTIELPPDPGQYAIPLASDPFGRGWDLFGTAGYRVDLTVVGARFAWYLAVIAIVVGHIVAVFLAHVQAMVILPERRPALRSQVPMTALMVAFTVISLSILAEPIVAAPAAARRRPAPRPGSPCSPTPLRRRPRPAAFSPWRRARWRRWRSATGR